MQGPHSRGGAPYATAYEVNLEVRTMSSNPQPASHERILLVEDSATQAARTRIVLETAGFQVQVCDRGTVALASAAANQPDLMLLDLYLPDLSGREVAQRLKADP